MSTVRMSDYLRQNIIETFKDSYDKAHPPIQVDTKYGDKVYNTYIGPNIKTLSETAEDLFGDVFNTTRMFHTASTLQALAPVTTSEIVTSTNKIETTLQESFSFPIRLSTERLMPREISSSGVYTHDVQFKFDRYEDKTVNYICECIEHNSELEAKKRLTSYKVNTLLKKFTTLNQAIKAWPALSKLVEPEKLAKVHEKQQRKRNQELQKEMADEIVIDNELNKTILTGVLLGDDD